MPPSQVATKSASGAASQQRGNPATSAGGAGGSRGRRSADAPSGEGRNEVALRGRLAAPADERTLPSGDEMVSFRLVVPRPAAARADDRRRPTVDTIDCVAWSARTRRAAVSWQPGDVVEVEGALRRRFWRGAGGGPASRCEVEVTAARVVR